jgi:FlaA1/EpsC-like NDP-sugar epimerase
VHVINTRDLLPRRERVLDQRPVEEWLRGKRVAVTGGGGFIGSELARQLATFPVDELLLIDNCEHNLYQIGRQLPNAPLRFGDVRDKLRMGELLFNIDIVFHAAAMKHVPMCEDNPYEAELTNIQGTVNVVDMCPGTVVFVSTDKAVNPSSHMGRTKRAAEQFVRVKGKHSIVRFGNVIGSSGSVVPLFKEQIEAGGPITVTHREMTRYFMTVGEAAELILQSGAAGPGTYVLDMGEPVEIWTLAEEMIRLSGRRDIQITETGIRPGEKLHEELNDEPLVESGIDGIWKLGALI